MQNWKYAEPPLLSVAYLAYNQESYVAEALDSILMQETDFPFEIVAHDDRSTDKTAEILAAYGRKYPNIIKLILQKENQYSKGIKIETILFPKTTGKYIAMLEGDDYWTDPRKLQIQVDAMRQSDCQMSFHSSIDKWEDKRKKDGITTKRAKGNRLFDIHEIVLGGGGFCPTASLVFEKEAVANMPEWFESAPFGDYFLQIFGSLKGGALYIDRPMAVTRRNAIGSWSSSMLNISKKEKEVKRILETYDEMDRYFDLRFHPELTKIKSDLYLEMALTYLRNNDIDKFKETIEHSYLLATKKTKKLLMIYHLRNFPILLQGIRKLYNKLNKYFVIKG